VTEPRREIREIALLTNPAAGHGKALEATRRAHARFAERGVAVRELVGVDADASRRLAVEAVGDGIDALVVVGGDGMVHLALPAVCGTSTALGVIPAGTGNDQARAYGWPRKAPEQARPPSGPRPGGHCRRPHPTVRLSARVRLRLTGQ
jgi:diacylglycerol kinase (ATP)